MDENLDDHPQPDDLKNPNQRTFELDGNRNVVDESWRVEPKKRQHHINWNRLGELEKHCLEMMDKRPRSGRVLRAIIAVLWYLYHQNDRRMMDIEFDRKENKKRFIDLDKRVKMLEKKLAKKEKK